MKKELRRFVVRKYIMATSAQDALRKEKNVRPDDVWVDAEWTPEEEIKSVGFKQ